MDIGTGMMNIAAGYREGQLEGRINQLVADSHKWARHCNRLKETVDREVGVKLLLEARVYCWRDLANHLANQHPDFQKDEQVFSFLNKRLAVHAPKVYEDAGFDHPPLEKIRFG